MPGHLIFQLGPPRLFQQLQARTETPLAWQAQSSPSSVGAQQGCRKAWGGPLALSSDSHRAYIVLPLLAHPAETGVLEWSPFSPAERGA